MALPTSVAGIWDPADTLESWARSVDAGPFSSLSFGGRITGESPEVIALAGAVAAWTSRVRLQCALTPQLYGSIWLAKSLVTLDRLSEGRIEFTLGVGARDEDYRALAVDPTLQNVQQVATRARRLRWVWQGDHFTDTVRTLGPSPVRPDGPDLLISSHGLQAARSGAAWADGVVHTVLGPGEPELQELAEVFKVARQEWAEGGRPEPRLAAAFWFALDETAPRGARAQIEEHLREYVDWTPSAFLEDLVGKAGYAGPVAGLRTMLRRIEALGADEVTLIPTSTDVAQVALLADLVGQSFG